MEESVKNVNVNFRQRNYKVSHWEKLSNCELTITRVNLILACSAVSRIFCRFKGRKVF